MHVTCPSCRTTYRVPAPYRGRRRPTFECAACGHVFEPHTNEPEWDDDEPFVMDDEDAGGTTAAADMTDFDDEEDEEAFTVEDEGADAPDFDADEDAEDDEDEDEEPVEDAPRRERAAGRSRSQAGARSRKRDGATRSSPIRFAVRSLLAVVIFYAIVGVYVTTFPDAARAAMQGIPLIGTSLARTPLGLGQIEIGDVQAAFQPLAGAGEDDSALIVLATVTNHAAVAAEQIDLAIDLDGEEPRTERRTCTGAVLNVSPFKRGELELMAGFNGSRVARIPPGESVTCQSIFLDYPTGIRSLRIRLVGAQGS